MDLDLTEAVEAAARDRWERSPVGARRPWDQLNPGFKDMLRSKVDSRDLAAAAPVIERQVREQIARDIEAAGRGEVKWLGDHAGDRIDRARFIGAEDAWKSALRIARGGAS